MHTENRAKTHIFIRILTAALIFIIAAGCFIFADELPASAMSAEGFSNNSRVTDSKRTTWATAYGNNCIYAQSSNGIDAVYVEFDRLPPGGWTVTDNDKNLTVQCGLHTYLHDYADLKDLFGYAPKNISIIFTEDSIVADVYAYSGYVPENVQKWQPYLDKADMVLLTTHSDDEQLFFAGVMPYYAVERKLDFQVVYFIQHYNGYNGQGEDHVRPHEQLDGLWAVGITHYPYISNFPDCYAMNTNRATALKQIQSVFATHGLYYDDFLEYTVSIIRRFKPQVLISHDLSGEYGHGAHVLNADTCTNAVKISGDPTQFPDSAAAYGTWTPKKLYLHMYDGEPIVMDWDTPYDSLGGYTPFQMTQQFGWMCHNSQHYAWFYRWILGTGSAPIHNASEISTYSPCDYGLYFRTVGPDIYKNDMFENLTSYADQERLMNAEAAAFASQAKVRETELAAKIKEEDKIREAALAAEEARLREEAEHEAHIKKMITIGCAAGAVIIILLIALLSNKKKKARRSRHS